MSIDDQSIFYIDPTSIKWVPFFTNLLLGVRKYLQNEEDKTLKPALKKDF